MVLEKVLIVEDSPTEALLARLLLEREGYQVSVASDGKEGLVRAAEEKPDLIILDTIMPRMSGYEAYQRLRVDPRTSGIPVIMLLTDTEATDAPRKLGHDADTYIAKPYAPPLLLAGVEEAAKAAGSNGGNHSESESQVFSADAIEQMQTVEEIQRHREELQKARKEAEAARRAKSEFLSTMSHELRTPLHEVMGMTDLVLNTELTTEQRTYLTTAKTSANALLAIINDILEFAELEDGQFTLVVDNFDLWLTVGKTVEIMAPHAREKGLKLSYHISSEVPKDLVGDPVRLRQVLTNLIGNAVRFTEKGEVFVQVTLEADHEEEAELHFLIRDTGIGIPEEKQEAIFETFRQADGSTTRQYGSIGLGLAMSKQLVELMDGRIWVESEVGQGSTFHFIVRLKHQEKPLQTAALTAHAEVLEEPLQLRILVAEDSPTNQLIAKANLTKAGHAVRVAENGQKAVEAWEKEDFDLILMDISMPRVDGLEVTRLIREKEKQTGRHIPIIAMTAFAMKEYREKSLDAGMDAYISKPVSADELHRTLESFLKRADLGGLKESLEPEPSVDLDEALEVVDGDVELLQAVVEVSLEECPEHVEALREALAKGDVPGVESAAHRLKGVMGNIGGLTAREVAQRLETMGEEGNLDGGQVALEELEAEIERVATFYSDPGWKQTIAES
jgi:signal transduction histidine kinase/HPt (histidine-containing phosphotransfer) domain-containing protein